MKGTEFIEFAMTDLKSTKIDDTCEERTIKVQEGKEKVELMLFMSATETMDAKGLIFRYSFPAEAELIPVHMNGLTAMCNTANQKSELCRTYVSAKNRMISSEIIYPIFFVEDFSTICDLCCQSFKEVKLNFHSKSNTDKLQRTFPRELRK